MQLDFSVVSEECLAIMFWNLVTEQTSIKKCKGMQGTINQKNYV